MDYRDPVIVIDQTIDNLTYLVEWWLEEIEVPTARRHELLRTDDIKTMSALRATRALLPRLRIVRSNYESAPSLPDASGSTKDDKLEEFCEQERTHLLQLMRPPRRIADDDPGT